MESARPVFDSPWHVRALHGEAPAIQMFAREMLSPLFSFCLYRVGRDRHLCEEVVQETLLRAMGELAKYEPERAGGDIFPWLTGLARNEIHRVLARDRSTVSLEALWEKMDREILSVCARLDAEPFNDELLRRDETRELVNATMSQLPLDYREALEAKYVAGKSVRDIADLWRVSEKAVESRLTRAREAFRATFTALARNLQVEG